MGKSLQLLAGKFVPAMFLLALFLCGSGSHANPVLSYGWSPDEQQAIALYKQGQYQLADNLAQQLLQSKRSHCYRGRVLNLRGICLAKNGKSLESNKAFREAEKEIAAMISSLKAHERVLSSCRLKLLYESAPEPILVKRYPWICKVKPVIKGDLIDLIAAFCVVPDEDNKQFFG